VAVTVRWACLAAATFATGWALGAVGLPYSYLFGALLAGIAAALLAPERLAVPDLGFTAAQAVAGVALGTFLDSSSLDAIAGGWLPLALVTAATLGISLAAGAVLTRTTSLDPPTAALGMVAGGAAGIVGMAGELGADDRLVAFMQYLRVLLIVLITPVLKFTLATIRQLGGLLGPVLLAVLGVLAACALLAVALDVTTSVSFRDAYLATTPGGLYAVLAVALGTDADAGFVLAAQGLRLVVMIALAPIVVRWFVRA